MATSSVVVICPDRTRRQALAQRVHRRFPDAQVAACAGVIDALPRIWETSPDLVVVAGLDVAGRNGWRLPELRAACHDAVLMTVGDPHGDLARAVRADVARPDWRVAGMRQRRRPSEVTLPEPRTPDGAMASPPISVADVG